MRLPDGGTLMHERAPYDPVKAREYYLRTRKLKGRKKGSKKDVQEFVQVGGPKAKFTVNAGTSKAKTFTEQQLKEQKVYAAARITIIKKKLAKLEAELNKRMKNAKKLVKEEKREAESTDRKQEASKRETARKEAKGPTAADKAEAARDSKKYRDKNQQKIASKEKAATETSTGGSAKKTSAPAKKSSSAEDSVAALRSQIEGVKRSLKAAVDRQKALSSATRTG